MRALPLLLLAGCVSDITLEHQSVLSYEPLHAMELFPPALDLGDRDAGESTTGPAEVRNVGEVDLRVEALEVTGAAWTLVAPPTLPAVVPPGRELALTVRFAPEAPYDQDGALRVRTDAPEGRGRVRLLGRGTPPVGALDGVDLGTRPVHCGAVTGLGRLTNTGGHALTVHDAFVTGDPQLAVGGFDLPATVAPGGRLTVPVTFGATRAGPAEGTLVVATDDREAPTLEAAVFADGVWPGPWIEEAFVVTPRAVDILLAVDRSASMRNDNDAVHAAFTGLVAALPDIAPDFQLGVVTGISACFNDTLFTPDTPDYERRIIDAMQGAGSPLTEALLGLARDAVVSTSHCNAGFLRPGAPLQLVVVSDEPEQSITGWQGLVDDIAVWLADPTDLHISGVVDATGSCGEGADGYLEAAAATDGVIVDVCAAGLDEAVLDLLVPSQVGVDLFRLAAPPRIETIRVRVDGEVTTAWSWDARRSAVKLDVAPPAGTPVTVEYRADGC